MTNQQVYQALRSRLNTLPNKPAIAYTNQPFTPVTGTPYLEETFLPSNNEGLTVTGSEEAFTGVYQVTVFHPTNVGFHAVQTIAEAIAAHFKRNTNLNGVIIESANIDPHSIANNWIQIPVSVNYYGYRQQ